MWLKNLYLKDFILARLILYALVPVYYCYMLFINTGSCASGSECILCGMKTAIWMLLHFDFYEAFKANRLVVIVILFAIAVVVDTMIIIKKMTNRRTIMKR